MHRRSNNRSYETQFNPILRARVSNLKPLLTLLRGVHFKEKANFAISEDGISVIIEESKCFQGHSVLKKNLFDVYDFFPERDRFQHLHQNDFLSHNPPLKPSISFAINLDTLVQCIMLYSGGPRATYSSNSVAFGTNDQVVTRTDPSNTFPLNTSLGTQTYLTGNRASVEFIYGSELDPKLIVIIEEDGVVSRCALPTFEIEYFEPLTINRDILASRINIDSDLFKKSLQSLDSTGSYITLSIELENPQLKLHTSGSTGYSQINMNVGTALEVTCIDGRSKSYSYKFHQFLYLIKALSLCEVTKINLEITGLLQIQALMFSQASNSLVEFYFIPESEVH